MQGLSLYLQRENASAVDAPIKVDVLTKTLLAYKGQSGKSLRKFLDGYNNSQSFKGTPISQPSDHEVSQFDNLCKRFNQSLCDNISSRFSDTNVLALATVLNTDTWPDDEIDRMVYGDRELASLAKLVGLNARDAVSDFREFKLNTKRVGKTLQDLMLTVQLYPISSAECERGFSAMNLQHTATRNRLLTETVSALLMIQINGPNIAQWPVKKYVITWLKAGRHSATDKATGKHCQEPTNTNRSKLFLRE